MLAYTSLVKYNSPVVVNTNAPGKPSQAIRKRAQAPRTVSQTEDILNSILPPREWSEDGQLWIQYVSSTPATRLDVISLQEQLDQQLQQRHARETGICPIREELYSQCFDELIRQITINCAERGLLLLRVRDQIRMTMTAYQTLYESSIAFGIRKSLMAEQTKAELEAKLKRLTSETEELSGQVGDLERTIEAAVRRAEEKREADNRAHHDDVGRVKNTNEQLRLTLETLLSAPKR